MLEQFCRAKKQSSRFLRSKSLPDIQKINDPGKQGPAFPWTDRGVIENPSFLDDGGFIVII